jgi:putative membrane protein
VSRPGPEPDGAGLPGPEPDGAGLPGSEQEEWRRLSSRMLFVSPVRELAGAIPALVGLVVAGRAVSGGQAWWLGPLGVLAVVIWSVLRWMTTRYRITPEQVELRTGVLQRRTIATPADRVRSVDVTASALHRLLGVAKVQIGTGSNDPGSGLSLDSLTVAEAAGLRAELLHRSAVSSVGSPLAEGSADLPRGDTPAPPEDETELARMNPRWVRFAPFTMSGLLGAAAILGIGSRLLDQLDVNAGEVGPFRDGLAYLESNPIWLDVLLGLAAFLVFVTMLSIGGYVLSYWGFRLTRHSGGSLHITRGLLTTRATSIEERRLRGVELAEPLLLRAVRGARLRGIATGLGAGGGAAGGGSLLLPPAPRELAREVASRILGDDAPVEVALTAHGPAARRRRHLRALLAVSVLVVAAGAAVPAGAPLWLLLPAVASVPLAVLLAADRYRSLGHALAGSYLVTRAGSLSRRREVLECDGIIGWNVHQTFFQRRAGLVTLAATTAAGRQRYRVTDVPLPLALSLATRATPGLLADFLGPAQTTRPRLCDTDDRASDDPAADDRAADDRAADDRAAGDPAADDPAADDLDPAGEPHPDLPLRVGDDLCCVDGVEEGEAGDAGYDEDAGRQKA